MSTAWYDDVAFSVISTSLPPSASSHWFHFASPQSWRWLARKPAASPRFCGRSMTNLPFQAGSPYA
nr:hypothetical protein [Phytohabitans suffuscus]